MKDVLLWDAGAPVDPRFVRSDSVRRGFVPGSSGLDDRPSSDGGQFTVANKRFMGADTP